MGSQLIRVLDAIAGWFEKNSLWAFVVGIVGYIGVWAWIALDK